MQLYVTFDVRACVPVRLSQLSFLLVVCGPLLWI